MEIIDKNIDENLIKQVYLIHKEKLGEGFTDLNEINEANNEGRLVIAKEDNECLGLLIFNIITEKEFFTRRKINKIGSDEKCLILTTCATKINKKGIGTKLVEYCINKYKNILNKIYCPVWQSIKGANIAPLLTKLNFINVYKVDNFWYEDSLNKPNYCPICGSPCKCNLLIYQKNINN